MLTAELAKRADKVVSIELDERLIPVLGETLEDFDNVTVINEDVLKADLQSIVKYNFGDKPFVVCANLPYYITSPIIMLLLESKLPCRSITVMVQKEAADRLCAEIGSRNAGAVSVAVDYYAEAQKLFDVSRGSFMPSPNVDSAVIRLDIREKPPVEVEDEKFFFRMVKACFAQRRKTASNSISAGLGLPKDKVVSAITDAGFDPNIRAEKLTMQELGILCNSLYKVK